MFTRSAILTLFTISCFSHAAVLHYGAGISINDGRIYLHDKTYLDTFSWGAAIHSDLVQTHSAYLDLHLYSPASLFPADFSTIFYGGIGVIFIRDKDNYVHDGPRSEYEKNYGFRVPAGIEVIHQSGFSVFAEIVPTHIFSPDDKSETVFGAGARYYFY